MIERSRTTDLILTSIRIFVAKPHKLQYEIKLSRHVLKLQVYTILKSCRLDCMWVLSACWSTMLLQHHGVCWSAATDKICELNAIFYSTLPKDFELLNFLLRCFLPDRCLSTTHPMLSEVIRKVSGHRARPQHRSTSFYFHGANCIVSSILLPAVFYIIQTKHLSHRAGSKSFIYLHSPRLSSFSF